MHDGAIPISSNQNRQNKGLARSGGNSSASLLEANGHPDFQGAKQEGSPAISVTSRRSSGRGSENQERHNQVCRQRTWERLCLSKSKVLFSCYISPNVDMVAFEFFLVDPGGHTRSINTFKVAKKTEIEKLWQSGYPNITYQQPNGGEARFHSNLCQIFQSQTSTLDLTLCSNRVTDRIE